ncbi:hypothetical protein KC19_VG006200 [Ceratodon purpureus]|uniref:Uncharacterized protein n=1 Tax=Ceratodon purpureus TaxID=3225 RepID=A0A8T0HKM4_CERPU|nr:hypothetical protein KC19_VG006200 [Ceratodon purpureus]
MAFPARMAQRPIINGRIMNQPPLGEHFGQGTGTSVAHIGLNTQAFMQYNYQRSINTSSCIIPLTSGQYPQSDHGLKRRDHLIRTMRWTWATCCGFHIFRAKVRIEILLSKFLFANQVLSLT